VRQFWYEETTQKTYLPPAFPAHAAIAAAETAAVVIDGCGVLVTLGQIVVI